ncbi:MAG: hypothetical protein ACOYB3_01415 [Azonexus sp.]
MNNALVTTGPDLSRADMFFDRPLVVTDWDNIRGCIQSGVYNSIFFLRDIQKMEPMSEHDPRDLEHWKRQQYLRLALLHEAGKPLELDCICETCGQRKVDPLFGEKERWARMCLHCVEEDKQTYNGGSRGNCQFVMPKFNNLSHSWGLLYYWSHSDNTFIFWLADFYTTRQAAQAALQPVKHYIDWLNVKYNGLLSHWIHFDDLVDLGEIMKMNLPLTPEQFRELLRSKIEAHMSQEQNVMAYYVRDALRDHERNERD